MDNDSDSTLPSGNSDAEIANNFLQYFKDKIKKIRESFEHLIQVTNYAQQPAGMLSEFAPVTADEVKAIVMQYGISCSPEDPLHVNLVKEHVELLIPFWTELVKISLSTGSMDCMKSAVIIPLLKELDDLVDPENYKNYRPVSNLLLLSKIVERCVDTQLERHMTQYDLFSKNQYAYKKGHCPELLLLNVTNSVLTAFDNNQAVVLLLLDLSAAFDTVDQEKLLSILNKEIGITGTALKWFSSFLMGRTQKVMIGDAFSVSNSLDYGVAQGSVLGPRLFNIYTKSLYANVHDCGYEVEGYADDHQLYKVFAPMFQTNVLAYSINLVLRKVSEWMSSNFLRLNKPKTKILVLAPPSIMPSINIHGTFLDEECIRFVQVLKI